MTKEKIEDIQFYLDNCTKPKLARMVSDGNDRIKELQIAVELKSDLLNRVMPCELEFKASLTLLRDLADIQNDAPLERDRKEWSEIMKSTYEFLDAHEA